MIRIANIEDANRMLEIYTPFILNSGITQENEVPSLEEFQQRILTNLETRPWLVCEIDGVIAGYAYAGKHRERKGYQWCTEPSVYIHEKFYRIRAAAALYYALFEILKMQGYVNAYAVITLPNDKSVAFHESFGFTYLTTYKKIGYKLGKWHDVGWWQLEIMRHADSPKEPIKFNELSNEAVQFILNNAALLLKK